MNQSCPFTKVIRYPENNSTHPGSLLKIISNNRPAENNGYLEIISAICMFCDKLIIIEGRHNPYYETWVWPEKAVCETGR